ncbi:hypothetical protein YA0002_09310 [Pseudomonas cichorii]|uniref:hypothetical protein n=1 Tax=Pseudomonas cichorii TaxID=36746 RepID=UPI0018E647AE|nr:hypothetical protein [Pseudomonas cichorii]MBI6852963.1 hypothetical protein [Pseudomonas cichorii]
MNLWTRVKKSSFEYKMVSSHFEIFGPKVGLQPGGNFTPFMHNGVSYRVQVLSQGLLILKFSGNRHLGHRTRFGLGMKTRTSTKLDGLKKAVSFDAPLTFPQGNQFKSQTYLVPHAIPNIKRRITQNAVMGGKSASIYIEENKPLFSFINSSTPKEWLHLRAHSHGGAQAKENLVAGSRDANSLQIGVEDALIFCACNLIKQGISLTTTVTCTLFSNTHIGRSCEYKIRLQSGSSLEDCTPIYIDLQYNSNSGGLQYDQVRAIFAKTCELVYNALGCIPLPVDEVDHFASANLSDANIQHAMDDDKP